MTTTKFNLSQEEISRLNTINSELIDKLDDKFKKLELVETELGLKEDVHEEFTEFLAATQSIIKDQIWHLFQQLKSNQMLLNE